MYTQRIQSCFIYNENEAYAAKLSRNYSQNSRILATEAAFTIGFLRTFDYWNYIHCISSTSAIYRQRRATLPWKLDQNEGPEPPQGGSGPETRRVNRRNPRSGQTTRIRHPGMPPSEHAVRTHHPRTSTESVVQARQPNPPSAHVSWTRHPHASTEPVIQTRLPETQPRCQPATLGRGIILNSSGTHPEWQPRASANACDASEQRPHPPRERHRA
ncbi:hypothetical protein SLEX105133_03825 [Slackia exigua]|nr:Uncharacterised protein [Slackia exigua]